MASAAEETLEYSGEEMNNPSEVMPEEDQSLNLLLMRVLENIVGSFNDTFSRVSSRCDDCLSSHCDAMEEVASLESDVDFETAHYREVLEASNQLRYI
jgi:hypothetical protein